ncbi:TPA: hypothetical protein EYP45_00240 [Candidatus Peregrinibacteria bacterium]|nr:hypothetical protein [Candidatus Peregrinibacteria bacterium]HIQ57152.1 hypothetical protein [Candidatus Gracilibacteria bacterium]
MLTLIFIENSKDFQTLAHTNRIQLFLQYKQAEYKYIKLVNETDAQAIKMKEELQIKSFPVLINQTNEHKEIFENSLHAMREIEEEHPHPIGFIGPVESLFQSTGLLLPKTFSSQSNETIIKFFTTIFEEIIDKIEYSDFLMGPTFSVADCVLAGDLQAIEKCFNVSLPTEISEYIIRVSKKCI